MKQENFVAVDNYISALLAPEDKILTDTLLSLEDTPNMSVSANQGKFLQLMAKVCSAKHILELGTFAGYSTIWLGRALPDDGKLITLEYDERHVNIATKNIANAKLDHIVEIRQGKALDILPKLSQEVAVPFDLIFIDADKPPYTEYFEWAITMSRPGTIIIADNVIRDGKVLDAEHPDEKVQGVRRFNEMLSKRTDVSATILQTVGTKEYDGMAIAVVL